jgi:hypothetical protein
MVPAFPAGCWQVTLVPSHWSAVQGFVSAVQEVPLGCLASLGQLAAVPEQNSAASHSPAEARHCVLVDTNASVGQAVLVPLQVSATSQTPAAARHTAPALPAACWQAAFEPSQRSVVQAFPSSVHAVPLAFFASVGQLTDVPVQDSATSHSPAAVRHVVVDGERASAGHVLLVPLQVSAVSQGPADARQTVLEESFASLGQVVLVPVQVSAASHTPAAARQIVPAFPAGCWHAAFVPSH